jgi:hypothetical protein
MKHAEPRIIPGGVPNKSKLRFPDTPLQSNFSPPPDSRPPNSGPQIQALIASTNSWKNGAESCGPGEASGWN